MRVCLDGNAGQFSPHTNLGTSDVEMILVTLSFDFGMAFFMSVGASVTGRSPQMWRVARFGKFVAHSKEQPRAWSFFGRGWFSGTGGRLPIRHGLGGFTIKIIHSHSRKCASPWRAWGHGLENLASAVNNHIQTTP